MFLKKPSAESMTSLPRSADHTFGILTISGLQGYRHEQAPAKPLFCLLNHEISNVFVWLSFYKSTGWREKSAGSQTFDENPRLLLR